MEAASSNALATELTARLEGDLAGIVDRMVARIRSEVSRFADQGEPELWNALRRAGVADLRTGLAGFSLDRRLPGAAPVEAADLARLAARAQIPLTDLLRAYRVAQSVYWDELFEAVQSLEATPDQRAQLLRATTRFLLDFVDKVSTLVTDEFTEERDRVLHRRELLRLGAVRDVLAGTRGELTDFDLAGGHIGLVGSGAGAEAAIRELADEAGARLLAVSPEDGLVWAWLGADASSLEALHGGLAERALPEGCRVGVGLPGTGAEGFRATHRQARAAHGLAGLAGWPLSRYRDVALEALGARDELAAREFVGDELRALAEEGNRARRLRETLLAYLERGQNGASAAAALRISPRTLSYRLRSAEALIDAPIGARSAELHTALRLKRLLDGDDPARDQASAPGGEGRERPMKLPGGARSGALHRRC